MTTLPSKPLDLALGDDGEDHPRRLMKLGNQIMAYGGDLGTISVLSDDKKKNNNNNAIVVRRFDNAVRAVAASHDGKRVAVGFDDGSTTIFIYENSVSSEEEHPFLQHKSSSNDEDDFLSQADDLEDKRDETTFPGPRFDSPVRHMQFDPRSYHICIASESGVCVVDVTSAAKLEERFLQDMADKEHNASGIRGVSYCQYQDKVLLSTLDMAGRLCVWDVTGDDPALDCELEHRDAHKCIPKPDIGEIHQADAYDRSCLPVSIQDSSLVLPGMTDVQLRLFDNVKEQHFLVSLPEKGHSDAIVAMSPSPDGKHLVTSGRDGRVVLWSVNTEDDAKGRFESVLGQFDSTPTHILWDESGGDQALYMACANGSLITITGRDKIVPEEPKSSEEDEEEVMEESQGKFETQPPPAPPARNRLAAAKEKDNADDSDDDVDFSSDAAASKAATKTVSFVVDEADEDNDEDTAGVTRHEDGVNNTITDFRQQGDDGDDILEEDDDFGDYEGSRRFVQASTLPEPQPPFAPSATPLELPRRIMCWNHIGTISYQRDEEGGTRNMVDIDFTDAATRRPITFSDNMDFILGSMGEDGAIFASDLIEDYDDDDDDEGGKLVDGLNMSDRTKKLLKRSLKKRMDKTDGRNPTGSKVYFHRFETFGPVRDKDWLLTLPDGERVIGCACGEGWSAVVTSRRFLRLFSSGGNQGQVVWLKGDPVAVVGRGKFLAVIYHEGSPLSDGTQKLGYTLFNADSSSAIASGSVSSISSGSQLEWAGFSSDCSLMVMDSDGMLSMLVVTSSSTDDSQYAWDWSPMLDTIGLRKSADDKFWPITVQDGKLVCVPLKGGNEYPDANRRPVTSALPFRMPLARSVLEKSSALEEVSVRANVALTQKKFLNEVIAVDAADKEELDAEYDSLCAQVDKVTLKLFMATADAGKVESALDLVDRLHLEKSFDIAITVADRLNHRNLSDRIEEKKDVRFGLDYPLEDDDQDDYDIHFGGKYTSEDLLGDGKESPSRRISPDSSRKHVMDEDSDGDGGSKQWNPPQKKFRGEKAKKSLVKPTNPFAKKRMESPARPSMSPGKSPSKLALSRKSTFSAKSREKTKVSKRIL